MAVRKYIDCRDYPSVTGCSLRISGREDEIVPVAMEHAVRVHGHRKSPALAREIRKVLKPERSTSRRRAAAKR
jgi:hypothetical protein